MKTTDYIAYIINRLPKGYVFTYRDFITEVNKKEAVIKGLNRMVASGKLSKLSRGKYYKPEVTVFGNLLPDQSQIVKDLLENEGKIVGYLTGYSIYNQLALTTQIGNTIQIGKKEKRPDFKRGKYTISFIQQKNNITKENIPLLQVLDAIRYIKRIPDTSPKAACKRFLTIIRGLSDYEKVTLIRIAQKYPPATKALLGALLEETGNVSLTVLLKKSLNPITIYKLSGICKALKCAKGWNIL